MEGTCCERLCREGELAGLLRQAGFGPVRFKTDFSSHANPGDYGFMARRVVVTAVRG